MLIGGIGELYIGGAGLARGYLGRAGLTAERFIANPYATEEDIKKGYSRIYKTGDLVRWLPDGNLEYIGRNDFQVKIRGYRIELGEIENALSGYKGISQSIVIAKEQEVGEGNKYLVGYYVKEKGEEVEEEEVYKYLGNKLPEYMVPTVLKRIEEVPLTINGKIDRNKLPEAELSDKEKYVAPRNEVEKKVVKIWSEVLGIEEEKVGIKDDFFRLGGDSIVSIQLVSRIRQNLEINIGIKDIFKYRTIEKLYTNVLSKKEK